MIKWLNAVIDVPAVDFDAAKRFWPQITNTTLGPVHPDHDEFSHLLPESGSMHLELQRIDSGPARVHLDLLVDDIPAATARAVELGATLVSQPGHSVLTTPGGMLFCIVPSSDEAERAPVIDAALPHSVDQICLDVPHEHFDADVAFWSAISGWDVNPPGRPEYRSFAQPSTLPLRLLVQQLGADDDGGPRAHLDISAGDHVAEVTHRHRSVGSDVIEETTYWTVLHGPAGQTYCVTSRPVPAI